MHGDITSSNVHFVIKVIVDLLRLSTEFLNNLGFSEIF